MASIIIGNVRLQNRYLLAPMAGITDFSFRLICREMGAALACSEMVSAKSIFHNNVKNLLDTSLVFGEGVNRGELSEHRPFCVQLFGREPEILAEAARRLEDFTRGRLDIIDINMGCPAPKIVKNGEGSALMREPRLAGEIIEAVARAASVPVTVKIRKGYTAEESNAPQIAKIAEESGAAAVTVHGRTRMQFYSGSADWKIIAAVKRAVAIPVIGNGDVTSAALAAKMFEQTGCDGIMVGRGALGNPWIFAELLGGEGGDAYAPPSAAEKHATALRHAKLAIAHKGERTGVLEMRKHLAWYIKGEPFAAEARARINRACTLAEMEAILEELRGTEKWSVEK